MSGFIFDTDGIAVEKVTLDYEYAMKVGDLVAGTFKKYELTQTFTVFDWQGLPEFTSFSNESQHVVYYDLDMAHVKTRQGSQEDEAGRGGKCKVKVAVLDDYQLVAESMADWSQLPEGTPENHIFREINLIPQILDK